jgi:hypothetical protein
MDLRLENRAAAAMNLEIGPASAKQRLGRLAPGASLSTNWVIRLTQPGAQELAFAISDARLGPLFAATTTLQLGLLKDPRPGYALTGLPALGAWWCESGWKIGRDRGLPERPKNTKLQPISISAARGETEAAQLVLRPTASVSLLSAKVGPLRDAQGRTGTITAEILEVAYVQVKRPTDNTCEAGWYPDPLPPLRLPMELAPDANQPLWISLKVDRAARASDYAGEVELTTSAGLLRVPLAVHVFDFEMPRETHLRSALGLGTGEINRYHHLKDAADKQAVYSLYLTNFAAHRISPYSFFDYAPIGIRFEGDQTNRQARVDFTQFDRAAAQWLGPDGFNSFMLPLRGMCGGTFQSRSLGTLEGFKEGTPEHARLFRDYLSQVETHLKDKGWLNQAYTYWFDEPDPKDYQFVVDGMKRIKAAAPGLRRLLTEQPEPDLLGHVEIWCGLTPEWSPDKVRARNAVGEEVWWYICCAPTAPYVTEFIDHPGAELRLWPWQSWQYGVQGILIWATTYWSSDCAYPPPQKQDPWQDPMSYVSGYDFKAGHIGYWGNGDGRFLYPPRAAMTNDVPCLAAPVTSCRWENLRDGMEDYEYFWLLRQAIEKAKAGKVTAATLREATALLEVPKEISRNTRTFTTDPRLMLAHRTRIAQMIERLTKPQP